jgi:septal ring factor EnvC (AmiA/AmiB activator)
VLGQSQALHGTQARQQTMHTTLDELTDTGQTLRREMGRQEDVLTEARSGQANKEKLLEKKKTRAQAVQAELKGLEQTSQELASLIDILRSKARQEKEEQKRERAANQKSGRSPIAAKSLAWPMRGTIAEKFGRQREQESGGAYISNGILITARAATMVKAVAAGTVLYAGQFMRYGSMVLVEHPGDWYSVYGHLNQWAVEKGQVVKEGDPIGGTGVRGDGLNETYFELRFYGKPVDPLPWLEP